MKNYLLRNIAGILVISSFVMCTKSINNIEGQASAAAVGDAEEVKGMQAVTACTYTVQPSQWFVDGTNIPAGSVICIPAGTRGALLLKNFKGTAANPIIITNKGGKVTFSTSITASYGFKAQNCQYFKILGNGEPTVNMGLM